MVLHVFTAKCGAEQVTPNLYGNLVANVVAGLTGGPGILPGVNVGDQCAVFEQVRHSALHAKDMENRAKCGPHAQ